MPTIERDSDVFVGGCKALLFAALPEEEDEDDEEEDEDDDLGGKDGRKAAPGCDGSWCLGGVEAISTPLLFPGTLEVV